MPDESKLRLFTAVEIPASWRSAIAKLRHDLDLEAGNELKWVSPDLMHITLIFLGYQPARSLPAVEAAAAAAASEVNPFSMTLGQVNWFGSPGSLSVIWVGLVEMPRQLQALYAALSTHLSAANIPFDQRALVPHITLARGRRPIDRTVSLRIHAALQRVKIPVRLATRVQDFVLMQSRLSPKGPSYQAVARFPLRGENG